MILIYKTETDSQTLKTNLWLPKGKGGGRDKEVVVLMYSGISLSHEINVIRLVAA